MARNMSARRLVRLLAKKLEPSVRASFDESIEDILADINIKNLTEALRSGNVEEALRVIGLDATQFRPLDRAISHTYEAGGLEFSKDLRSMAPRETRVLIRFDIRNTRAEEWLRGHSSELVSDILDDQRVMLRKALRTSMEAGRNPRSAALDIVGRLNRVTGKRVGGHIGLTSRLEEASRGYNASLRAGDAKSLRRALSLDLRDRRFDRTVLKAIREGKKIPAGTIETMTRAYRNRALKHRGNAIARTEMLEALQEAKLENYRQAVERGAVREQDVTRFWRTAADERVRDDHKLIASMNPNGVGLEELFQTPDGAVMRSPHGPNCRCDIDVRVDFLAEHR